MHHLAPCPNRSLFFAQESTAVPSPSTLSRTIQDVLDLSRLVRCSSRLSLTLSTSQKRINHGAIAQEISLCRPQRLPLGNRNRDGNSCDRKTKVSHQTEVAHQAEVAQEDQDAAFHRQTRSRRHHGQLPIHRFAQEEGRRARPARPAHTRHALLVKTTTLCSAGRSSTFAHFSCQKHALPNSPTRPPSSSTYCRQASCCRKAKGPRSSYPHRLASQASDRRLSTS
jgi:hypothetical protein